MNAPAAANTTQLAPAVERQGLVQWAASKFGVDAGKVFPILKATCFKGADGKDATDAEVAALMIVAREHGLNPFLREIYAFPDKKGGIVPIVGIDGWISMANSHPQYNGVEFIFESSAEVPEWVECHIFRKDRGHAIKVREFLKECRRDTGPWKSHPSRMLRHKAFIQCARVAFGFAGIYDPDEGDAIATGEVIDHPEQAQTQARGAAGLKQALLADDIKVDEHATGQATEKVKPAGTVEQRDAFVKKLGECKDTEILGLVADEARDFQWTDADQAVMTEAYRKRLEALGGGAPDA